MKRSGPWKGSGPAEPRLLEGEGGKPVPIDHVEKILPQVDRRIGAMIRLQLLTGMRPGEVIQMTMRAIDMTGLDLDLHPVAVQDPASRQGP